MASGMGSPSSRCDNRAVRRYSKQEAIPIAAVALSQQRLSTGRRELVEGLQIDSRAAEGQNCRVRVL